LYGRYTLVVDVMDIPGLYLSAQIVSVAKGVVVGVGGVEVGPSYKEGVRVMVFIRLGEGDAVKEGGTGAHIGAVARVEGLFYM
jgi:hypothetical protein